MLININRSLKNPNETYFDHFTYKFIYRHARVSDMVANVSVSQKKKS